MDSIKKYMKYFLPVITLPTFYILVSSMFSAVPNVLGSSVAIARRSILELNSIYASVLYLIAVAVLFITALLAERGKIKAAKTVHLVSLIVYVSILIIVAGLYPFFSVAWVILSDIPFETYDIGLHYASEFMIPVLLVALIAVLLSQLSGKHSCILVMALGAGIIIASSFAGAIMVRSVAFGLAGLALTDGLCFAVSSVVPFLMVPVKSYAKAFAPSIPE